jgi:predicted TIM-barrel fold metal-dependent hydrolase
VKSGRAIFDSHLHIIDPRFPLVPNSGYLPPAFTVGDYLVRAKPLGVAGGAVVSGSFQAFDQTYLLDALRRLGAGFAGVTQLPVTTTDAEIRRLDDAGVRAVRFNLYRGGSETLEHLDSFARRVFDLAGWHAELYLDAKDLPVLEPMLASLPKVSIDHLGMSEEGRAALLRLVESGMRVKATGFGRVTVDVPAALTAIHRANPTALMVGTDLPSTRAKRPFADGDLDLVVDVLGDDAAEAVLHSNARAFYDRPAE